MHTASKVAQICTGVYFARMSKLRVYFTRLIFGSKGQDIVQRFRRGRRSRIRYASHVSLWKKFASSTVRRARRARLAPSLCVGAQLHGRANSYFHGACAFSLLTACARAVRVMRAFFFFFLIRQDILFQTTNIHSCLGDRRKCT